MFIKVVIPASLPTIFTGLRLGLGLALVVIIAAEFVASRQGLGYMIWLAWSSLATSRMYSGLVMIGVIGLLTTVILRWIGLLLMPWETTGEGSAKHRSARTRKATQRFFKALGNIPSAIFSYSHEYLYVLPAGQEPVKPPVPEDGLRFAWIDHANVEGIRPWKGWQVAHQFQRNLNRGMIGIYAYSDEEVVGYVWGSVKTSRFSACCTHHPIQIGDGITHSAEVQPEYRRQGIASHLRYMLLTRIMQLSPDLKIERICGTVLASNTPMHKLIERQGSIRIQTFTTLRFTPWFYLRRLWDLDGTGEADPETGRYHLYFKVPEVLSDPLLQKVLGRSIVQSQRAWQPQGEF